VIPQGFEESLLFIPPDPALSYRQFIQSMAQDSSQRNVWDASTASGNRGAAPDAIELDPHSPADPQT